ncbi:MAG: hypothetical protein MK030_01750, partial [SAR116 cluster bacterium]|nr:hypothetical protein [SAR116 cluster bacterium]
MSGFSASLATFKCNEIPTHFTWALGRQVSGARTENEIFQRLANAVKHAKGIDIFSRQQRVCRLAGRQLQHERSDRLSGSNWSQHRVIPVHRNLYLPAVASGHHEMKR